MCKSLPETAPQMQPDRRRAATRGDWETYKTPCLKQTKPRARETEARQLVTGLDAQLTVSLEKIVHG